MHNSGNDPAYTVFRQLPIESLSKYDKVIGDISKLTKKQPISFSQNYNAPVKTETQTPKLQNTQSVMSHWNFLHACSFRDGYSPIKAQEFFWLHWWGNRPTQCSCKDAFSLLDSIGGICFDSEEAFFTSGVAFHNVVNQKLQLEYPDFVYPQTSIEQARLLWHGVMPHKHKRAIVTVAAGQQYKQLLAVFSPSHEAYAKKVGADYLQLTNRVYEDWKVEKFRAGLVAKEYDETLFVDADVFIRESCPDIFGLGLGAVFIHDDMNKLKMTHWCQNDIKLVASSQKTEPWITNRCLNTGFFTCTKKHNPWVAPHYPLPEIHCGEQWWVDRHVTEYVSMPSELNWQWWFFDFWDGMDDAHVVHLANCPKDIRVPIAKDVRDGISAKHLKEKFEKQWSKSASL